MAGVGGRCDHGTIEPSAPPPSPPEPPPITADRASWAAYARAARSYWREHGTRHWAGGPPWATMGRHRRHWWYGHRSHGPLRRSRDDRMIGGVAAGVAARLGFDITVVRIGFVLGALASGFGLAAYVLAWLLVPAEGDDSSIAGRAVSDWRGIALALSVLPVVGVVLLVANALGAGWLGSLAVPLGVGAGGLVLVYRNVGDEERAVMARVLRPLARLGLTGKGSWRGVVIRVVVGLVLASAGAAVLLAGTNRAVLRPLGGVFLVVAAAVVVFGPWWLHIARDLVDERQARALAEERADMAARVHDSVLQTLALIQRRSDQPQQVVKLARAQERELRSWLFDGHAPGSASGEDTTLAAAVNRLEREVEERHEVAVEAVVVGDCLLDDDLRPLIDAGREAAVNAAKWSGAPVVSLFVEVEPDEVSMFVRDRGIGFDPAIVRDDRKGLAESVHGRLARHGGTAEVRSSPGGGTEVVLRMPRHAAEREKSSRS